MKLIVALLVFTAACGSTPAPATTPPAGGGDAVVTLPDVPFAQLDKTQKIAFMKQNVLPTMKPLFQNHDPKDFAEFKCTTCHGDGAKEGKFDMPNPNLPKLNFADHNSKYKKEDLEWMGKEIMPTMGKILNLPLYSADNPKGFGCLNCHTKEG